MRVAIILFFGLTIGSAIHGQTGANSDSTKTKKTPHLLFLFNHYPEYSLNTFHPSHTINKKAFAPKYFLRPDYPTFSLLRIDNPTVLSSGHNGDLSRPDFLNQYDPLNPNGAGNVVDGVICGSLDYLLWKLFGDE